MFYEVIIKMMFHKKCGKNGLTDVMSKIKKKFTKLLQNLFRICYNDYTINSGKG